MSTSILQFEKALNSLKESIELYEDPKQIDKAVRIVIRDACVLRFKYCTDLAWRTSLKALGSNLSAPKPAVREMARNSLIDDVELWFGFIDARNATYHTYCEDVAVGVFNKIKLFYPEAEKLVLKLKDTI
jgi:nucleotidyltransferase substrate binding protein (TIGR01987 family)